MSYPGESARIFKGILGKLVGDVVRWKAGSCDDPVHSNHYQCVVKLMQIMDAPRNGKRRRRDLMACLGSATFVPWTDEPLNVLSRGRFPRVMVTSSWDPAMLADVEISRGREGVSIASSSWFLVEHRRTCW